MKNKNSVIGYQIIFAYMFSGHDVFCQDYQFQNAKNALLLYYSAKEAADGYVKEDLNGKTKYTIRILQVKLMGDYFTCSPLSVERLIEAEKEESK